MLLNLIGDLFMNFFTVIIMFLMVLVGVSFFTLLERKILGYIQIRKGPNKLGIVGFLQPFSDAIKLLSKEFILLSKNNYIMFYLSTMVLLVVAMMCWGIIPVNTNVYSLELGLILMLCFMSFSIYSLMIAGWSSNSTYSMLGAMRSVSQMLSYEVSMILIIIVVIIMFESYSLMDFCEMQELVWSVFYLFPIVLMFMLSILAELNRTPFDFVEGESELVSGFNTEYFGVGFTLIFMGEYMMIMFMSMLFMLLFLGGTNFLLKNIILCLFISLMIIWIRGMLPRMRYDELMYLCWKKILPISLIYMMFILNYKMLIVLIK